MFKKIYSLYCIILFCAIILIFYFLFLFVHLLIKNKLQKFNYFHHLIYAIFSIWYFLCGFKHKQINTFDAAIKDKPAIFIANHTSYMDIPPLILMQDIKLRIIGKKEGLDFPIFRFIYNEFVVSFHRRKWRERAQVFVAAKNILQSGFPIFIFPEGRFYSDPKNILYPFENGAFELAIQEKIPIQPFIYLDSNKRLKPVGLFYFSAGKNSIHFLPLMTQHLTQEMTSKELKERCFELMHEALVNKSSKVS